MENKEAAVFYCGEKWEKGDQTNLPVVCEQDKVSRDSRSDSQTLVFSRRKTKHDRNRRDDQHGQHQLNTSNTSGPTLQPINEACMQFSGSVLETLL